jgi:PAS domain S-box-containing protein
MEFYFKEFSKIRKLQRISIQKIVNRLDKSYKTVWCWEKGKHKPRGADVRVLARILGVDVSEISDLTTKSEYTFEPYNLAVDDKDKTGYSYIQHLKDEIISLNRQLRHQYNVLSNVNKILDTLQSLFYTKKADLKFTYVNNAFALAIGYEKNEIIGRENHELLFYNDYIVLNKLEVEVLRNGVSIRNREIYIPGTQKKKYGLISIYPEYEGNRIISLNCSIRDISERKRTLQEIDRVKNLLKVYATSMSNGLTISSYHKYNGVAKGRFLYINNAHEEIYSYSKELFLKKDGFIFWLNTCVHPDDRVKETAYYESCDWPKVRRLRIWCPDGTVKWIQETMSFVNYLNRECSICEVRDVTAEVKMENEKLRIARSLSDNGIDRGMIIKAIGIESEIF